MDTELAKTFLTVASCGSFLEASERLNITQSTVSMRVRRLEETFGKKLFIRGKSGARLTEAGRRFHRYAVDMLRTMQRALDEMGATESFDASLTIAARVGLWDEFLLETLSQMQKAVPTTSIRAEVGFEADLIDGVTEGKIDIVLMFTPQSRPGVAIEHLFDERLVLVRCAKTPPENPASPLDGYVSIDWGPDFSRQFMLAFPDAPPSFLTVGTGWLGINHLLRNGGAGYFPLRIVSNLIREGRFERVLDAPEFTLPAYLVYSEDQGEEIFSKHLQIIRDRAARLKAAKLS